MVTQRSSKKVWIYLLCLVQLNLCHFWELGQNTHTHDIAQCPTRMLSEIFKAKLTHLGTTCVCYSAEWLWWHQSKLMDTGWNSSLAQDQRQIFDFLSLASCARRQILMPDEQEGGFRWNYDSCGQLHEEEGLLFSVLRLYQHSLQYRHNGGHGL